MEGISFAQDAVFGDAWIIVDADGNLIIAPQNYVPQPGHVVISIGEGELVTSNSIASDFNVSVVEADGRINSVDVSDRVQQEVDASNQEDDSPQSEDRDEGSSLTASTAVQRDGAETIAQTAFDTDGLAPTLFTPEQVNIVQQLIVETVQLINNIPDASDGTFVTSEDDRFSASVPNATDSDGEVVSYELSSDVESGDLIFRDDGSFDFDPDGQFDELAPGESRSVDFEYIAIDDRGGVSESKTITIVVTGINDAPTAVDDNYQTLEYQPVLIDPLANDFDIDGDELSIISISVPQDQGSVYQGQGGQYYFAPADGFSGEALISYTIQDESGLQDSAQIKVSVEEVNEPPEIRVMPGAVTEGQVQVGDPVATYETYDEENDALEVDFTPGTNDGGFYQIIDGEVVLTQPGVDWVNGGNPLPVVDLTVKEVNTDLKGTDSGIPTVNFENDAPKIEITPQTVYEDQTDEGDTVATFVTSDEENDETLVSFLPGSNSEGYYALEEGKVVLTVKGAQLVNSGQALPLITLVVTETKAGGLTGTDNGTPVVIEANDPPVINVIAGTVTEDATDAGDEIATYTVNDEDEDQLQVEFTSGTNDDGYYELQSGKVVLTDKGAQWVNQGNELPPMDLTVREVGSEGLTDSASDTPTVVEVNDKPVLTVTETNDFIENEASENDIVAKYQTYDEDGDEVTVTLSDDTYYELDNDGNVLLTEAGAELVNSGQELPPFTLTPNDGVIDGDPSTVDPSVTEVNDPPEFISGNDVAGGPINDDGYDFGPISEGTSAGTVVGQVDAFDEDNDVLEYFFSNGTDTDGIFTIDTQSGEISLNVDVDDEDLGLFQCEVIVRDPDGEEDSAVITIDLTNVNEAPEFLSGDDEVGDEANADSYDLGTVTEGTVSDTLVGQVAAYDPDSGDELSFTFADGSLTNGVFTINETTGEIRLNQDIDDADLGEFELDIKVTDKDGLTDTATVSVELSNVNEAPEFLSGDDEAGDTANLDSYDFGSVAEGTVSGTLVGQVAAYDPDSGDELSFTFADGSLINGVFTIDETTGEIRLNQDIDDTDLGEFELDIKVTDKDGLTDTATVSVELSNVNEAPEFLSGDDEVGDEANADSYDLGTVTEGTVSGTLVGQVAAYDPDSDDELSFTFADGSLTNGVFTIDETTGEIRLNQDIDDADLGEFELDIKVTDKAGLTDTATVSVELSNVNEAPEFLSGDDEAGDTANLDSYDFGTVVEGTVSGTLVGQVAAYDPDSDDELSFTFADGSLTNGVFTIDETTGEIRLNQDIDDADLGEFELDIKVTDKDGLTDTATVSVDLINVNEAPIAFDDSKTTDEETVLNASVPVASDADGNLKANGYELVSGVVEGSLTFNNDGSFTFDPGSDFDDLPLDGTRDVTFTYTASDDLGAKSEVQTITIRVTGTNDAPIASDVSLSGTEDTSIAFNWSQFNISDPDSLDADLSVVIKALPQEGTLKLLVNNVWTDVSVGDEISYSDIEAANLIFVPDLNESGDQDYPTPGVGEQLQSYAQFEFAVSDGITQGASQTMTLEISAKADAPTLIAESITPQGLEDGFIDLWDLSASLVDTDGSESLAVRLSGFPEGTIVKDGDGNKVIVGVDGIAVVSSLDLANLKAKVPTSGSYTIEATATATETSNGDQANTTLQLPLEVEYRPYEAKTGSYGDDTIIGNDANELIVGDVQGFQIIAGEDYNIAFVLDTSGSMRSIIETAKDEIILAVDQIIDLAKQENSGQVNIMLSEFATNSQIVVELDLSTMTAQEAKNEFAAKVEVLNAASSTNYEAAFETAIDWFDGFRGSDANSQTFFITDGEPTRGIELNDASTDRFLIGYDEVAGLVTLTDVIPDGFTLDENGEDVYFNGQRVIRQNEDDEAYVYSPYTGDRIGFLTRENGEFVFSDRWEDDQQEVRQGQHYFAILAALSNVDAIGLGDGVDIETLMKFDSDGVVEPNIDVTELEEVILGKKTSLLPGSDSISSDGGKDIVFGDGVTFNGIEEQGVSAIQKYIAQEQGILESNVSAKDMFDYIEQNIDEFNQSGADDKGDMLDGGAGDDILFGQGGDDLIISGSGNDILIGGTGADTFIWKDAELSIDGETDKVVDFSLAEGDKIDLSDVFGDVTDQGEIDSILQNLSDSVQDNGGNASMTVEKDGKSVTIELQGVSGSELVNNLDNIVTLNDN